MVLFYGNVGLELRRRFVLAVDTLDFVLSRENLLRIGTPSKGDLQEH